MNLNDIDKILLKDRYSKKIYLGGYAKDDLPFKKIQNRNTYAIIVNTDLKAGEGIHWFSIVYMNKNLYIYDSLARNPFSDKHILQLIKYHKEMKSHIHYIAYPHQSPFSNVCGLYAIFAILYLSRHHTFEELNMKFDVCNMKQNDLFIIKLFKYLHPKLIDSLNFITM